MVSFNFFFILYNNLLLFCGSCRMPLLTLHLAFLSQFGQQQRERKRNNHKNEATIYLMIILNDKQHFFLCLVVVFPIVAHFSLLLLFVCFSVLNVFLIQRFAPYFLSCLRLLRSNTRKRGEKIFTHCTRWRADKQSN